jgi:hypothetical protein
MTQLKFRPCTASDSQQISDFLYSIGSELDISERTVSAEMTALLFANGGIIGGYDNDQLAAVVGYFHGDPSRDFADKQIGFIYVAALAKPYRGTSAFSDGLTFTMHLFKAQGLREVRLHALETNARLNAIYSQFARPLRRETNRRGYTCVLYGNRVDSILARRAEHRLRQHAMNPTPRGRLLIASAGGV